ncbi:MAG: hypothetical protein RIF46_00430 [Cyclobacteriaceae bacterium]
MRYSPVIFLVFLSFGCSETEKFNRDEWNERVDGFYVNRSKQIDDVVDNHLKTGMSLKEIRSLLGSPDHTSLSDNSVSYQIELKYERIIAIDPTSGKNLVIKLSDDSLVTNFSLENWSN